MAEMHGTRERIMAAALEEFATHGVAGARMERIARGAKANKESIYRYYGLKHELLASVLEEYLQHNGEEFVPQRNEPFDEYVASLFRLYQSNPQYLRLCLWEGLELGDTAEVAAFAERQAHYQQKIDSIRQAQDAGIIDKTLDPRHLMIVLLGMANYWFAVPQIVHLLFGQEPDEAIIAEHEKFLTECCRRIIAPRTSDLPGGQQP